MTTIRLGINGFSRIGRDLLRAGPHKDSRRARSAAVNLIPTSTGAAGSRLKSVLRYDNEWGYANRTLDLAHLMARTM